jgi:hypothetical protein
VLVDRGWNDPADSLIATGGIEHASARVARSVAVSNVDFAGC